MKIEIKNKIVKEIANTIKGSSYENKVFVVGGFVRDLIMGRESNDIDLLIDGDINAGIDFAEWFCKEKNIFKKESNPVIYGLYGTAMFHFMGEKIESVAPRSEKYHEDNRNPEVFSCTIKDDAMRRDFTINALFVNISTNEIIDYTGHGINDINNKIIRTCGDPKIIFNEDSLRIFRMVRFAARFSDFKIDEETFNCAKKFTDRLSIISRERITDEFTKMMTYSYSSYTKSLCLMWDLNLFKWIIPEFQDLKMFERYILLTGLQETTSYCGTCLTSVLGKLMYEAIPLFKKKYGDNNYTDNDIIRYYLRTCLNYPNDVVNKICLLIKENKKLEEAILNEPSDNISSNVRRVMNECGDSDLFLFATAIGDEEVADYFCERDDNGNSMFDEYNESEEKFYTYKLPITGEDVMEIFGIEPGKTVKEVLNKTLNFVFVNPFKSSREDCLAFVKYLKEIKDAWGEY